MNTKPYRQKLVGEKIDGASSFWGEGNGTPLQYSCLENPMDGGDRKAGVHGVAEGQTRLKRLSSSIFLDVDGENVSSFYVNTCVLQQ